MSGGIEAYDRVIETRDVRVIAMSVLASGADPARRGDQVDLRTRADRVDRVRGLIGRQHPPDHGPHREVHPALPSEASIRSVSWRSTKPMPAEAHATELLRDQPGSARQEFGEGLGLPAGPRLDPVELEPVVEDHDRRRGQERPDELERGDGARCRRRSRS